MPKQTKPVAVKTTVDGSATDPTLVESWQDFFGATLRGFADVAASNIQSDRQETRQRTDAPPAFQWQTALMFLGVGVAVAFIAKRFIR